MRRILALALLGISLQYSIVFSAVPSDAVFEVRPTNGDNTFGAGYAASLAGGSSVDYTQQTTAQLSLTDVAHTGGSTTYTSVTGGFTAAMIGNAFRVNAGANCTVGYYFITAVTDTNTMTADRSCGASDATSVSVKVGGASKSISGQTTTTLAGSLVAGNTVYIKNEAWNEAVVVNGNSGTNAAPITYEGYNSTRGDAPTGSNRPRNNRASAGTTAWNQASGYVSIKHLWMSNAGTSGFSGSGSNIVWENVRSSNNGTDGWVTTAGGKVCIACEGDTNTQIGLNITANVTRCLGCYMHGNTQQGMSISSTDVVIVDSIIAGNGSHGISVAASGAVVLVNNTIDSNTGAATDGISLTTPDAGLVIRNNIIANNGRYGINSSAARTLPGSDYNDYYGNGTAATNNLTGGAHDLTSNPTFTNSGAGDYSIGTPLRNQGFPGTFPASTSTGRLDMGAVQSGQGAITQGACHRTVQ